jgi:hypothetical protein
MKDIKETIQTLFISRKSLFVFLCLMLLTSIVPLPFWGSDTGYTAPFFSLTSDNEPLKEVLAKISKSTGYKIEITKGWDDKTLTVDLRKVDLEKGLREIMRIMGGPNYSLIINESGKKVEIRIFDNILAEQKKSSGAYVGTNNDFRRRSRVAAEGAMVDVSRGVEKPEEPPEIEVVNPDIDAMRRPE